METILSLEESEEAVIMEKERKTPDGLMVQELPNHLHYAFLGENGTKTMIVSTNLNDEREK